MTPERKALTVAARVGLLNHLAEQMVKNPSAPVPARLFEPPPPEIVKQLKQEFGSLDEVRKWGDHGAFPSRRGHYRKTVVQRRRKNQIAQQSRKRNRI